MKQEPDRYIVISAEHYEKGHKFKMGDIILSIIDLHKNFKNKFIKDTWLTPFLVACLKFPDDLNPQLILADELEQAGIGMTLAQQIRNRYNEKTKKGNPIPICPDLLTQIYQIIEDNNL